MPINNPEGHNQHSQGTGSGGGSHEQRGKPAESNKKDMGSGDSSKSGTRGGSHEQHVKAGQQSHKNS